MEKHALVIGIDAYPFMKAEPLRGCVNDAHLIQRTLTEQYGFEHVLLLVDQEATRKAILAALARLLVVVEHDDIVAVHFSGHGSRVQWLKGFAESLVPQDSGRHQHPNRDIVDLEIASWLDAMAGRTRHVTLTIDACHAAGITRSGLDPVGVGIRRADPDRRTPEDQHRPSLAPWLASTDVRQAPDRGLPKDSRSGWLPWDDRYTLIAGCRSDERACELKVQETGVFHGALSYFLAQELERARVDASWRDVFELAALRVSARFPHQHPQLEGAVDREVFARAARPPEPFVPILRRHGQTIVLGTGAAHGALEGSKFDVFHPGTRRRKGKKCLGRVVITSVEAVESQASVLSEIEPMAVGGRAFLVEQPRYAPQMSVRITSHIEPLPSAPKSQGLIDQIWQELDRSPFLQLNSDPQKTWEVDVRLQMPAHQGAASRPVWTVHDPSGGLLMSPRLANSPAVSGPIRRQLEQWARYRALAELRPLDVEDPIGQALELEILRLGRQDIWLPPDKSSSGQPVFQPGDRLALILRHQHPQPLHIAVFNLGLSGGIRLLHPMPGGSEPLLTEQPLDIGKRPRDAVEVFIPEAFPFGGEVFREGQEIIKVIATEEATTFDNLSQDGIRDVQHKPGIPDSPLTRLLRMSLTGKPERRTDSTDIPQGMGWTAIERGFLVRDGVYRSE